MDTNPMFPGVGTYCGMRYRKVRVNYWSVQAKRSKTTTRVRETHSGPFAKPVWLRSHLLAFPIWRSGLVVVE